MKCLSNQKRHPSLIRLNLTSIHSSTDNQPGDEVEVLNNFTSRFVIYNKKVDEGGAKLPQEVFQIFSGLKIFHEWMTSHSKY